MWPQVGALVRGRGPAAGDRASRAGGRLRAARCHDDTDGDSYGRGAPARRDRHSHRDPNEHANGFAHGHGHTVTDPHCDAHAERDSLPNGDCFANADGHANPDRHAHRDMRRIDADANDTPTPTRQRTWLPLILR